MTVALTQEIMWFTHPTELRQIADDMERHWPTLRAGQSVVMATRSRKGVTLKICADQERMTKPEGEEHTPLPPGPPPWCRPGTCTFCDGVRLRALTKPEGE